jgi:adenylosuccinate lyase
MERESAYRGVQAAANHTLTTGEHFGASLAKQGIDVAGLGPERFLAHHDVIHSRLEKLHELED